MVNNGYLYRIIQNNNNTKKLFNKKAIKTEYSHNPKYLQHSKQNKLTKIINGNIEKNKTLKIVQCNKDNALFINSIHTINEIIQNHNPDVICLSEANITPDYTRYINMFPEYNFELNLMYNDIGLSRNIIMIRNYIPYMRRNDLENTTICSIWLEVKNYL